MSASGGGVTVTSDGRCTCCPYGYHIDVDFMRYLEDMNSSTTLRKLKKIHRDKKKLRKSMEIYVKQQELQIANEGKTPPPDVVNQSERYIQVSVSASERYLQVSANEGKTPPPDVVNASERYLQVSQRQRVLPPGQCQRQPASDTSRSVSTPASERFLEVSQRQRTRDTSRSVSTPASATSRSVSS